MLPLDAASAPKAGDLAYILQHPNGQQKRLGFVRNMISEVDDGVVRYLTDTEFWIVGRAGLRRAGAIDRASPRGRPSSGGGGQTSGSQEGGDPNQPGPGTAEGQRHDAIGFQCWRKTIGTYSS